MRSFSGCLTEIVLRGFHPETLYPELYDNMYGANWVLLANATWAAGYAWFDLSIAVANMTLDPLPSHSPGQVAAGSTLAMRYPGLMGGPVYAGYHGNTRAFSSRRILWPAAGDNRWKK